MSSAVRTTQIEDFTVVAGALPDPSAAPGQANWVRRTTEILDRAGEFEPRGRLSGSFIYAHPPDYRGRPALRYSAADWRTVFREFKELGLEFAIWQASAFLELGECYYPSRALSSYQQWNVVEPMLQAAADEQLPVYLGCVCVIRGEPSLGVLDGDAQKPGLVAERELACARELVERYRGGFQGWYLSTETTYTPTRNPLAYSHFGLYTERLTNGLKDLLPGARILASPASIGAGGREQEAVGRLLEAFGRARVDAFAPMDCIGQLHLLDEYEADLGVWKTVASETGAEFWTNCESFRVPNYVGDVITIEPAEPRRFLYQLTVADKLGARKLVTWEAMHFLDPNGAPPARALRQAVLAHQRRVAARS